MKERTQHRQAFDLYLRMGSGRSLENLHRRLRQEPGLIGLRKGPSRSTLDAWSSGYHWQARLLDLEREARRQDKEAQVQALREMQERHIREGLALQQKGIERLNQLSAQELPVSDAIRAVLEGVKLERLARGEPTEHVRQEGVQLHGHLDLSRFTNEELRRLAELAGRSATGAREEEPR
jgi:hypothetical protein